MTTNKINQQTSGSSYLLSHETQLQQEVLSQLDLISHGALLHLRSHGLGLCADALL